MRHWAAKYIGRRDLNCWELLQKIYEEEFNIEVPSIEMGSEAANIRAFNRHDELSKWLQVNTPREGDAALMTQRLYSSHVGVVLAPQEGVGQIRILHTYEMMGAIVQDLTTLGAAGFKVTKYYRYGH